MSSVLSRFRRTIALAAVLVTASVPSASAFSSPSSASPGPNVAAEPSSAAPEGALRIAVTALGNQALDPMLSDVADKTYFTMMYDFLATVDVDGNLVPERSVAETWEESEDLTVHTITIHEGITFWDGTELTAEDVKYSLDRIMSEESQAAYAGHLRDTIDTVTEIDPYTIEITTRLPYIFLKEDLSQLIGNEGIIVSKAYIEEHGDDYFRQNPMGSGPYEFTELAADDHLTLTAHADYWQFTPRYETLEFRIVPEEQTRGALLQSGEVDIISSSSRQATEMESAGFTSRVRQGAYAVTILMNAQWQAPFDDPLVREALNIAIDRDGLNAALFGDLAMVTGSYSVNSLDFGYKEQPLYEYDPERAQQLLEESGDPHPPVVIWSYERSGFPEAQRMMEAVATMWQAVGFEVEIRASDYGTVRGMQENQSLPAGSVNPVNAGGQVIGIGRLTAIFGTEALLSVTHDPMMDELIDTVASSPDLDAYRAAMGEISDYIRANHITIPLFEIGDILVTRADLPEWQFTSAAFSWDLLNVVDPTAPAPTTTD